MSRFSEEFARLYEASGPMKFQAVHEAVRARAAGTSVLVPKGLYVRISEWNRGTVPQKFDGVLTLVLLELIDQARKNGNLDGIPTRIEQWKVLWAESIAAPAAASSETQQEVCPYQGLSAYTADDVDRFFGRSEATRHVVELVREAATTGGCVVVAGASGAGKSSLLAAGVVPALATQAGRPLRAVTLTPGADPMTSLRATLGIEAVDRDSVRQWATAEGAAEALIIVDQAEELFTVCEDEEQRNQFIATLAELARAEEYSTPAAAVVLGCRADFLERLLDYETVEDALRHRLYLLGPMRINELKEVIAQPARDAGLRLDAALEDLVITDLCGPGGSSYDAGALPLLSHALAATWAHRSGNRLTVAGYQAVKGVAGALIATAEDVWNSLSPEAQNAARRIIMRLVHIGDNTRDTRQSRSRRDVLDFPVPEQLPARRAFDALTAARLITVDGGTVSLTHEVILSTWPRLREWIEEDRALLLVQQRLERAADDWQAHDQDPSLLYTGTLLGNARTMSESGDHDLTRRASQFLDQSIQHEAAVVRRRKAVRIALIALSVVALVAAGLAVVGASRAGDQRDEAQFGQLVAEAQRLTLSDPSTAAQLNLVAGDLQPDDEATYTRLLATENLPLATLMTGQQGAIYTIAVSPDGRTLASSAYDNSIWLWNISDQTKPVKITQIGGACAAENTCEGHENFVTSVAFSPDGKTLASTGGDKTVRLWDISNLPHPKQLAKLTDHTGTVYYCAWSPDGKILVSGSGDNTVRLWNTTDVHRPTPGAVLSGHTKGVRTVAFSPDGHTVASGGDDRTVRLWDVTNANTAAPLGQPLTGHTDTTHNVTFSPDGSMLASGADDNTVRLWSLADRAAPTLLGQPFSGHTGPIWSVSFGPDGRTLATSSLDNTAKVFNILNPAKPIQVGQTLAGGGSSIYSVAYTNGGRTIATSDASGTIRLWSIPTTTLTGHAGRVIKPAIARGRMASASYDGTVNLWDIRDPAHAKVLDTVHDPAGRNVYEVALSPDGKLLATAIVDSVNGNLTGSVEIRAIGSDGRLKLLTTLHVPSQYQDHVVFSPDSRILATASSDNAYQLWSLTEPAQPKKLGQPLVHSAPSTTGNAQWATGAAFSPDGKTLVLSGADKELTLWDINNPAAAKKLDGTTKAHDKAINYVAFSPDGHTVASGGDDRTIKLWNVQDGRIEPISTLTGLPNTIRTLEFTDHGNKLVSAGDGQIVLLWDTTDPAEPRQIGDPISIPGNGRWYAAVDPSATMVVAGGDNGALQITILDEKYAEDRICHDTHNVMNETLWAEHVPNGIDYNPPCSQ